MPETKRKRSTFYVTSLEKRSHGLETSYSEEMEGSFGVNILKD